MRELRAPVCPPPGIAHAQDWPVSEVALGDNWTLLMYTDGLIEGRIGDGPGAAGQRRADRDHRGVPARRVLRRQRERKPRDERLLDGLVDRVRELNGGDLDDDLAVLALGLSLDGR